MGAFTNFLENELLDHTLGTGSYTMPTTVYVSLHTADPTETGSSAAEVSGNNYARTAATFSAASGGSTSNSGDVTFPTASGSWGTVTHWALWDASTAGNALYYGALTASKTVGANDIVKISSGQLTITLD